MRKQAIESIQRHGILLVFPMKNNEYPKSLWTEFYPHSKMEWRWDIDGDDRVGQIWLLMKELSVSKEVVYSKWYKGRATFFSKSVFISMLRIMSLVLKNKNQLSFCAQEILEALRGESPLSTKQLKEWTGLKGRLNEPTYNRSLKELFSCLQIVGFGEVNDGAFPSLAVGATQVIFEDLYRESRLISVQEALDTLNPIMVPNSLVHDFFVQQLIHFKNLRDGIRF